MHKQTVFGCPGTGKTHYLINDISTILSFGTSLESIGYVSFTKAAISEAIDRIASRLEIDKREAINFKTIHASCFAALNLKKDRIVSDEHYKELSEKIGYKLTNKTYESLYELPKGDLALQLDNLARLKMISPRKLYDDLDLDIDYTELSYISEEYNKFKLKHDLLDYTDMLEKYLEKGSPLPIEMFYVDEAQDLSLLQWKVIEKMASLARVLTVAGDDDQAIYQWSGADVDYFLDFANNSTKIILDKSYRCKEKIRDYSMNIIKKVSRREDKTYQPVGTGGEIEYCSSILDLNLEKGQWKVLVRNNYLQEKVISHCQDRGYYYTASYDNKKYLIDSLLCYEDIKRGKNVDIKQFKSLLDLITKRNTDIRYRLENNFKKSDINLRDLSILNIEIDFTKPWFDAFIFANYEDLLYIRSMLRMGENLRKEPRITIESIHSSKGKEADNVALLLDISKKTYQGMQHFIDPELRCLYVATTRAKNKLVVVQPEGKYFYEI